MNKLLNRIIILCVISSSFFFIHANNTAPFSKGVNLTSWFQSSSAHSIQFTKYTKQDFLNIKSLGADVIRLPINLHAMTNGSPNYTIEPLFFYFLDQVVDWSEELDIQLILDNHSFDPAVNTDPSIENILILVWQQMAEHYKDRSNMIYYEILNEPHGINDNTWNHIQLNVINAIREIDSMHTLIVGPAGWNSYHNLKYMHEYSDTNLIYTFHFYDPFLFTHQGANWTDPPMSELRDLPFPYDQASMPDFPSSLNGTWIQSSFNNYSNDGTVARVKSLIDIAADFMNERNIKIFCGEFGVYIPNSNDDDRVEWYRIVRQYLEEKGIAWTIWDYQGAFGIFEKGSNELFEYDLNIPLVQALGLNEVEQSEFTIIPDTSGFPIYSDFIEDGIFESGWIAEGELNFYADDSPADGEYSISWSNSNQYGNIGFSFIPFRDLHNLVDKMNLRFFIKGDTPTTEFDVRFIDTKTDVPEDHPWRMRYTVNAFVVPFDSEWHLVEIPLKDFSEGGSWDNDAWFDPIGQFDWSAIDRFEIVAEQKSLNGINLWFDQIEIADPNIVSVRSEIISNKYILHQNYPNPFNPSTKIKYTVPAEVKASLKAGMSQYSDLKNVSLKIFDILGREVAILVNEKQKHGNYVVEFDGSNLSSGLYLYKLIAGDPSTTSGKSFVEIKKMILLK